MPRTSSTGARADACLSGDLIEGHGEAVGGFGATKVLLLSVGERYPP